MIASVLRAKKLSAKGKIPTRRSTETAGYELYSARNILIPAGGKVVVPTDISITLPEGCYGRIAPRSGPTSNHFIKTGDDVIDTDFTGPIGVVLFNFAKHSYRVCEGDCIAQLILGRIYAPQVLEIDTQAYDRNRTKLVNLQRIPASQKGKEVIRID